MKGAAYHFGYNKCMGDPEPMFRLGQTFRYEGNAMKALIPDMMMKRWYHPEGF